MNPRTPADGATGAVAPAGPRRRPTPTRLAALVVATMGTSSTVAVSGCARHALLARGGGPETSRQDDTTAARAEAARAFDQGVEAYARGESARALGAFERAYALAPAPAVLYNLARVHEELGHDADAARAYVAYLRAGDADAAQRREVTAALARLEPRVAWLLVRARGALTIDGGASVPSDAFGPDGAAVAAIPVTPGIRALRTAQTPSPVAIRARAGEVLELDFTAPDTLLVVATRPVTELRAALAATR